MLFVLLCWHRMDLCSESCGPFFPLACSLFDLSLTSLSYVMSPLT
uniref:Uncharacterized protein n=1 Tax=Anguilla anguilla TaxID=7936 RepID=A0A0E9UT15_ANGAN